MEGYDGRDGNGMWVYMCGYVAWRGFKFDLIGSANNMVGEKDQGIKGQVDVICMTIINECGVPSKVIMNSKKR